MTLFYQILGWLFASFMFAGFVLWLVYRFTKWDEKR